METFKRMISGTGVTEAPRVKCTPLDRAATGLDTIPTPLAERVDAGVVRRRFQYSGPG